MQRKILRKYYSIPRYAIKVPLPDTMQKTDYSCGAAAAMAVCRYFGVGFDYEEEFIDLLKKIGMESNVGSHPYQLERVLRYFKLKYKGFSDMTIRQLKSYLRDGLPVLMMIQAYGEDDNGNPIKSYKGMTKEGHWVVAIGFDDTGIFFEDPSLEAIRGYISYDELEERWQDTGPNEELMKHYGLIVSKPKTFPARSYARRARHID